jgi:hypothetical protein
MRGKTLSEKTANLIDEVMKRDPKTLEILNQVLEDPKRAMETLDFLIRSPSTTPESRARYQGLRSAVENYAVEVRT